MKYHIYISSNNKILIMSTEMTSHTIENTLSPVCNSDANFLVESASHPTNLSLLTIENICDYCNRTQFPIYSEQSCGTKWCFMCEINCRDDIIWEIRYQEDDDKHYKKNYGLSRCLFTEDKKDSDYADEVMNNTFLNIIDDSHFLMGEIIYEKIHLTPFQIYELLETVTQCNKEMSIQLPERLINYIFSFHTSFKLGFSQLSFDKMIYTLSKIKRQMFIPL